MYLLYHDAVFLAFKTQSETTQSQQQDQKICGPFNHEAEAMKPLCETLVN